jgi:hypothetical protein
MMGRVFTRVLSILLAFPLVVAAQQQDPRAKLPTYEGRYYVIHTDLTGDEVREADLRMTKMAEEYKIRTRDFSGAIGHKFPFFLFRDREDYYAAGGQPGSAGVFSSRTDTLMALAGDKTTAFTWNVVQHEGFHQFARSVIGGELPVWVNEGLAEYFGEGVFTGDGFVTGVISAARLERVRTLLRAGTFRPLDKMMALDHETWNQELKQENYDQAWSMVQFLAHGEGGRYQKAFGVFMRAIGTGVRWDRAWGASFGSADQFEQKWKKFWLELPDRPTHELYVQAIVQTLTGVLARATAQGQKFTSFEQFSAAAKSGSLKSDPRDWLPPRLLESTWAQVEKLREGDARFELIPASGARSAMIICTIGKELRIAGRFKLKAGRVLEVVAQPLGR